MVSKMDDKIPALSRPPRKDGALPQMRESINKALVTHLLQHAGHLKLTAVEKQSLQNILEHVEDRDHMWTTYTQDQNGQLRADNPCSLWHLPEKLRATLCEQEWTQLELHNCRPLLLLAMLKGQGIQCETLQDYTRKHGRVCYKSMIQALRDHNDGVTVADIQCVVKEVLHGTALDQALQRHCAQDGRAKITDTQWLPGLEQDVKDAVSKLNAKGKYTLVGINSSDTATHVDEDGDEDCDMDEVEVDPPVVHDGYSSIHHLTAEGGTITSPPSPGRHGWNHHLAAKAPRPIFTGLHF